MYFLFNKHMKKVSLLLLALTFTGCSIQHLEDDMEKLKLGIKDLRSVQAEQTLKIADLEEQLRRVSGSIEEVQYATDQKLGRSLETLQGDLSSLKKRVPPPAIVPEDQLLEDEQSISALPTEMVEPVTKGLESLRQGDFQRSLAYWDECIDLASGTDWEPLAVFWRAVTLEGLTRPSDAIQEYLGLVKSYPKSTRAPVALYRQANLLVRLGDRKVAKITYNKLVADYPKSPLAAAAKQAAKDL